MDSLVAAAAKLVSDAIGGSIAGGMLGKIAQWNRRRRVKKLLTRSGFVGHASLEPVTDGLIDAGKLEIHVFRVACTLARTTTSYVSGQDPVLFDGATLSSAVSVEVPELERVLLLLQSRACLTYDRAPIVDARTLNGITIRVARSAVEFVSVLSEEANNRRD